MKDSPRSTELRDLPIHVVLEELVALEGVPGEDRTHVVQEPVGHDRAPVAGAVAHGVPSAHDRVAEVVVRAVPVARLPVRVSVAQPSREKH